MPTPRSVAALVLAPALLLAPAALAQGDVYAGKTVRITIGFDIAGTYGQWAQLAAAQLRKHIPGQPAIIVQPMPGAGGLVALNHVANVAPKDGTSLMVVPITLVMDGLSNPQAQFDPAKFEWIGRMTTLVQVGIASPKSGVRSLDDARKRELTGGGTGASNPTSFNFRLLNEFAGTRFKIVSGYKGQPDSELAWERGEIDAVLMNWDAVLDKHGELLRSGRIAPLYVYALRPPPELKGVAMISELGRTDVEKAYLAMHTVGTEIGRTLVAAPGTPKDRVALLRAAFDRMVADPEFKAAATAGKLVPDTLSGQAMADLVAPMLGHSPEMLARIKALHERLLADAR